MSFYYLEITRGIESGRRYALSDGAISIGRGSGNTIVFHSGEKSVSGHHAILYKSSVRIMLQDLQSTNGTFVNEENVKEKDIVPGDIVGFGAMGPRAKLIESAAELPLEQAAAVSGPKENTRSRTVEDDRENLARNKSRQTARLTLMEGSSEMEIPQNGQAGIASSRTMELEQRIVEKRASAGDMHLLLKDGRRVAKIVGRGNLGQTQAGLILGAYHASKKMRLKGYFVLAGVIIIALAFIVYFAGRAWQYRHLLDRGQSLELQLDQYDRLIAEARADPEANSERLSRLIDNLERAGMELASVKVNLKEDDAKTLYSDPVEGKIAEILLRFGETSYHVPAEMVERVKYHIEMYSGSLKPSIVRYIKRREKYYPMIKSVLSSNNLPQELSCVAMLESGFNPNALSHVGARGMWQFMPATGRRYGLRVDDQFDERVEPDKATQAAAEYFKDLIGIFGGKSSLMLAMAAYNAGEGRVQGALRKIEDPLRNRDFWYIYRMGYLAEETNEYIPRVFALLIISENPSAYGFEGVDAYAAAPESLEAENDFVEFSLEADYSDE